jgi:hypothetical protein
VTPRANGYPCPLARGGWVGSKANPTVFGPAQQPGQEHTMISCSYSQDPKHLVSVVAEYALPTDPNPLSDFYFGCSRRARAWTGSGRTYLVESATRWSYVEFTDPSRELPDSEVGTFKSVAHALLDNVSSSAHPCRINTRTPTLMRHLFLFGFEFEFSARGVRAFGGITTQSAADPLLPEGSFSAVSEPNATVLSKVVSVTAPILVVKVVDRGKQHNLRIRFGRGVDFLQRPPLQRLRLRLDVVKSNYSRCAKGAHGVLTIGRSQFFNVRDAPATIRIQLCGSVFGRGTYRGAANIISG